MNRIANATLIGGIMLGLAGAATARTVALPCQVVLDSKGSLQVQVGSLQTEATTVVIQDNEAIVFAEFSLENELEPGTEVELWPQVEGEVLPWDLAEGSLPFDRNFWITDERTGSLVRFDVTAIVRAWETETLPDLGFVLRITNAEDIQGQAPTGGASPNLASAKEAALLYHIQPVRPPKAKSSSDQDDSRPSGKGPRAEDGRGGKN